MSHQTIFRALSSSSHITTGLSLLSDYYQWVPVVLGMQCILFMVIRILWQMITFNRVGTDIQRLVNVAQEAGHLTSDDREGKINHIVKVLEEIIFKHRDFRTGRINDFKKRLSGVLPSKRLGNQLSGYYIIMKLVCIANNLGQIFLIQHFLGLSKHYNFFGVELLRDIAMGKDWKQTMIFPRVTFCRPEMKHLGVNNKLVAQCALPVNMLNEKIFIFLWFWMVLGVAVTFFSIFQWVFRINMSTSQAHFVRRYLRVKNEFRRKDRSLIKMFTQEFLRRDGIFVLKMLSINVGDLTTSDIVTKLWHLYKEKYSNQDMRRGITNEDDELSGENGTPMDKTRV